MIDIHFYEKIYDLKRDLMSGNHHGEDLRFVFDTFEKCRSVDPVIYNIETTNACNMKCKMCPRTTMMTRKVESLKFDLFVKIVDQIRPWSKDEMDHWHSFVEEKYGIPRVHMSENHFFLHVIPELLVLHGYGDPLLDKNIAKEVKEVSIRGMKPYFSCNPANIDIEKNLEMFENGLAYVKYSIESVDDFTHKSIRGSASNFYQSYEKILYLLKEKKSNGYKTVIIITMLNLGDNSVSEFEKLKAAFDGQDVYIYLKSQDQQWYENKNDGTESIHWTEFCQFPWSSMTIKSNGEAVECVEDYNNEIVLGDTKIESLKDIWNSKNYETFRKNHFYPTNEIKCTERCDMKLIGNYFGIKNAKA